MSYVTRTLNLEDMTKDGHVVRNRGVSSDTTQVQARWLGIPLDDGCSILPSFEASIFVSVVEFDQVGLGLCCEMEAGFDTQRFEDILNARY